jgi:hypothetical protein
MAGMWRSNPGLLLLLFAALDLLGSLWNLPTSAGAWTALAIQFFWLAVAFALLWCIWRRSRIAWTVLLSLTLLSFAFGIFSAFAIHMGLPWSLYLLALLVPTMVQAALLMSPAVRGHVRQRPAF